MHHFLTVINGQNYNILPYKITNILLNVPNNLIDLLRNIKIK